MSANTRGVANPDAFSPLTATPAGPVAQWPRAVLRPTTPADWWWGTVPGAVTTQANTAAPPAPSVAPPPSSGGPGSTGGCGCG